MSQMKIVKQTTLFRNIAAGENFVFEGERYIKVETVPMNRDNGIFSVNAVCLKDGKPKGFGLDLEINNERGGKTCRVKDLGAGEYFVHGGRLMQAPKTKGGVYWSMGNTLQLADDTEVLCVKSITVITEVQNVEN